MYVRHVRVRDPAGIRGRAWGGIGHGPDVVALQDPIGNLVLLDTATFQLHPMARDHGRAWIEDLAWFADGNHLAIASADNSLAVWRVRPLTRMMHTAALIR